MPKIANNSKYIIGPSLPLTLQPATCFSTYFLQSYWIRRAKQWLGRNRFRQSATKRTHLENLMLFSQNNPLTQATSQCVLPRCQMFPEAKLNDKWNGIEEGKVELGRRDKLNSPPPSPSLSGSLPPCLNHHHLYNLSQINYILSHLFQTFLVLKNLILLAVVSMKIILTDWEGVISNCGKNQKWCICWGSMSNSEV